MRGRLVCLAHCVLYERVDAYLWNSQRLAPDLVRANLAVALLLFLLVQHLVEEDGTHLEHVDRAQDSDALAQRLQPDLHHRHLHVARKTGHMR